MPARPKPPRRVVVAGDITIDWNLARTRRGRDPAVVWNADERTRACWQRGGAALMGDLVQALAAEHAGKSRTVIEVREMVGPCEPVHPADDQFHHSYAMWSRFKDEDGEDRDPWRVAEFLGLDRSPLDLAGCPDGKRVVDDPPAADLVILDDADLGFRCARECWPKALENDEHRPWILLKMARPVAQGPLWEMLRQKLADRLIVVMTVDDLRLTEVHISRGVSWERTAQDLFWELTHNPRVNALTDCAHVVVSFHTAGALLLSQALEQRAAGGQGRARRDPLAARCRLLFDPLESEGTWAQKYPGGMIGYTSCLTAGLARVLIENPGKPAIEGGVRAGLRAMRTLHRHGYDAGEQKPDDVQLAFPARVVVEALSGGRDEFTAADVQNPVRFVASTAGSEQAPDGGFWTILHAGLTGSPEASGPSLTLDELARRIVRDGAESALEGVPLGKFGELLTADRREIESFRSIRNLIAEYCGRPAKRPLSLAVFGPPGSGKSFGVEQVACSLGVGDVQVKSFNLSQFAEPDQLLDALHQVRDIGLAGKIPLIFWDEFDTSLGDQHLGWLRYFLAPMQDGSFQEGQITHPIGRAIFVFAGGTRRRMEEFDQGADDEDFKKVKGPDFVSRLRGYVDIMGPDPRDPGGAAGDPFHIIRRAILLRSTLHRNVPQIFENGDIKGELHIDPGVLRAFLHVRRYRHGARSMEAIIGMSTLHGKTRFERSSLPPEAQLNLHVEGIEFLALAQQMSLEGDLLERMAAAAHAVWRAGKERDHWTYGPVRDNDRKISPLLVDYAQLPETYKDSNRTTVRNIPRKLAAAGYVMIPSRSNETPLEFPGDDLEKLAMLEHELWMEERLAAGFQPGKPTPEDPNRSEYLVPWAELSDEIKAIDRNLIRGIPRILAEAGFAIVKVRSAGA